RRCRRAGHRTRGGASKGQPADMLRFTEQQMTLLRELAAPLAPSQRSAFLQEVARRLHGVELGDGAVAQAAREAQAAIRNATPCPWVQPEAQAMAREAPR